jgi:arylsulfatase A-like enzyme
MAGTVTAAAAFRQAKAAARRPNIVFIMADDLGYADLSCYGRRDIATPRIDRLAREGVRFVQAYANSPVCSATRVALMTGRYQYRLRVGLDEPLRDASGIGLPPEHPSLPSLLRAAGYHTALVGKWHLGALPEFGPLQSGYEKFFGFRGGAIDYYTHVGTAREKDLWDGDARVDQAGYLTDLLGDRATSLVGSLAKSKSPFFLSVHFNAPHWPWEPPGNDSEARRISGKSLRHFDGGSMQVYREMVERLDLQVGRILDALSRTGSARDTLVVFTSDNGGERFSDTWPFSGRKTELLEGGVRIPAMMRWPGRIRAGLTTEQVSITMDWLPTLLAAAGVAPDADHPPDGVNLMPFLTAEASPLARKLFWRFKSNGQRSVRDGEFKWLKIQENSFLFNVADDPMERANLRDRHRDVFDRLAQDWEQWNTSMLAEIPESPTAEWSASEVADRYPVPSKP